MRNVERFQRRFRAWLGPNPEVKVQIVAQRLGYSVRYVRWAAGLSGGKLWPGSQRFVQQVTALGCTDTPWRDRPPEELARAFREREVLIDPRKELGIVQGEESLE